MGLQVLLGDVLVGRLQCDDAAHVVSFRFDEGYVTAVPRPVLGRVFEDMEISTGVAFTGTRGLLPNFFRNYLPEGALRLLVQREVGPRRFQEYQMLERLGTDLPGNLRVVDDHLDAASDEPGDPDEIRSAVKAPVLEGHTRFSVAGLQLKKSVLVVDDRITIPVSGLGGRLYAKLPSPRFPQLPENEFIMYRWASACGINVPQFLLLPIANIVNLPTDYEPAGANVFVVHRFDRSPDVRVHMEDFAQVFDLAPEQKYSVDVPDDVTYASIARIVHATCGLEDFLELARRYAFMIISGNCDGHVKNWSLTYPDGRRPRLSPAYDLVSTVAYQRDNLALEFFGEISPYSVQSAQLRRLAEIAGTDAESVMLMLVEFVSLARQQWLILHDDPLMPAALRSGVDEHLRLLSI